MLVTLIPVIAAAAVAVPVTNERPRIVVEGFGSVDTPANIANLSYDVLGEGRTSDEAVKSLVAKTAAVERAIKTIDPGLKLESESMRVEAVRGNDCKEEDYEERLRLSAGACAILGYVAKQDFDIQTGLVADAGTMVGLAGRQGAANPKIDSFQISDRREARQRAIAAALTDAKGKAQAIAAGSNAGLGDVITISLDGAAVRAEQEAIVVTGTIRGANFMSLAPVTVLIKPGPVQTTANVTVSYELRR